MNIDILDDNYESIMSDNGFSGASENTAIPTNLSTYLEAGTYYIKVSEDGENGRYKLKANFTEAKNNEKELNNGVDQAQTISANTQKVTGLISWNDTADYYKVKITKAGKLTVDTYSYVPWLNVDVYDSNMQNVMSYYNFSGATESTSILNSDTAVVKAGTYYISIKHDSDYGKYKLSVKAPSMLPKSPTVNKVKKGAKKITGKTIKNSTVTVKIGSEKYTGKSNSNGEFSIKVPAQKSKTKIYVSVKTSSGTSTSTKVVVK
ncbi:Ig-like domain-containing protein [Rummeliibacillus sp. NPDC094406]|uniref:Ig-like domain-containing protein n=1 Tax=Rummeliibacillus sp. NPDC094406 TaxID=3364511 RepID=UPI003807182B